MTGCPYCQSRLGRPMLRLHLATNACGECPAGVSLPYSVDERAAVSEDDYRKLIEAVARATGWLVCHIERAQPRNGIWVTPAAKGFPDDWLVHAGTGHIAVLEIKTETGKVRPEQRVWLAALARNPHVTSRIVRPSDWAEVQQLLHSQPDPSTGV